MTGFSYCNEILTFPSPSPPPSTAVSAMVWYTIYNAPYTRGPDILRFIMHIRSIRSLIRLTHKCKNDALHRSRPTQIWYGWVWVGGGNGSMYLASILYSYSNNRLKFRHASWQAIVPQLQIEHDRWSISKYRSTPPVQPESSDNSSKQRIVFLINTQ